MRSGDTIVALSSGTLPSGVAVIRLSGPEVRPLLVRMAGLLPEPRRLTLRQIGQEAAIDRGLVAYFPGPHSFTGEDCAELQVHGSPAGVRSILRLLVSEGARLAEAGEFTRRAFENGKLDLVEVEGLGDLLQAETENQRRQALARFQGGLTQQIDHWRDQLLNLRAEIEAHLDFSDEGDVGETLPEHFEAELLQLRAELEQALASTERGRVVREGVRVALAGAPNVGKSSLINALSQSEVAIVTEEAGTTRDVREVPLDLDGQYFILLDLAGLRETDSLAEAEGIRRAHDAIGSADVLLWLQAPDVADVKMPDFSGPIINVCTKADLGQADANCDLRLSTLTGGGLKELVLRLKQLGQDLGSGEPTLLSRERDRTALEASLQSLHAAQRQIGTPELAAENLRQASYALERLLGKIDPERVLDRLFTSFCIGK